MNGFHHDPAADSLQHQPRPPRNPLHCLTMAAPVDELEMRTAQMAKEGVAEAGKEVLSRYCPICHSVEEAVQIIGPSLFATGDLFQFGVILASSENPYDVAARGGYELVMPEDLVTRLTQQELMLWSRL